MKSKIVKYIKSNELIRMIFVPLKIFLLSFESDERLVHRQFKKSFKRKLNIKNPQTFNEKLNWIRFNGDHHNWCVCADKYAVREFVKSQIGERYLIPLLGVYDDVSQINFDKLPKQFVMKANHGSSWNIICLDKNRLKKKKVCRKLDKYLNSDYYILNREIQYKDIAPKIICEKFIGDNGNIPEDYKIFCFHGVPHFIQVDESRQTNHVRVLYDINWNMLPLEYKYPKGEPRARPETLDEMLGVAEQLSKDELFVRVDLYSINHKVYFGEMTFTPENAIGRFVPNNYDYEWGKLIKLPL